MRVVLIVPFLNESQCLPTLLASLAAQERRADRLVLVDDGSSDGSRELAETFASSVEGTTVLQRRPQDRLRDRLQDASEYAAFHWALEQLDDDWDVVAKLDADLDLPTRALQEIEQALQQDERLGLVGTYLQEAGPTGAMARIRIPPEHVHGATKFYRRQCWEQIAPVPTILGWDTIDERTARRMGWRTASLALSQGDPVHLRPRGSYDGALRAFRRFGRCDYAVGEPPLLVAALAVRHARQASSLLPGLHYAIGYVDAAARRARRADPATRAHTRREEWAKVRQRLRRTPASTTC